MSLKPKFSMVQGEDVNYVFLTHKRQRHIQHVSVSGACRKDALRREGDRKPCKQLHSYARRRRPLLSTQQNSPGLSGTQLQLHVISLQKLLSFASCARVLLQQIPPLVASPAVVHDELCLLCYSTSLVYSWILRLLVSAYSTSLCFPLLCNLLCPFGMSPIQAPQRRGSNCLRVSPCNADTLA